MLTQRLQHFFKEGGGGVNSAEALCTKMEKHTKICHKKDIMPKAWNKKPKLLSIHIVYIYILSIHKCTYNIKERGNNEGRVNLKGAE